MPEIDTSSKKAFKEKSHNLPEIEEKTSVKETELWEYKAQLQRYFLSGKASDQTTNLNWQPLSLLSLQEEDKAGWIYPIVLEHKSGRIIPMVEHLSILTHKGLREEDFESIQTSLFTLSQTVHEVVNKIENVSNTLKLTREVIEVLYGAGEKLIEPEKWIELCKILEKDLVTEKISIIGFSGLTTFLLFKYQLNVCHSCHLNFLDEINKRIAGLNDILVLHGGATNKSGGQFGFASDLVSFDKLDEIAQLEASSKLPETRLKRIQKCYNILVEAQKSYKNYTTIIYSNKELAQTYHLDKICDDGILELIDDGVCNKAKLFYQKEIQNFALVTGAMKVADLELTQQYVEDLHDAYFESYNLNYLGDDDLQFMRTVIVIDYSQELMKDASDFMDLVSGGALVNIIGINRVEELQSGDYSKNGYLELATMAYSRRKAFVYQGGVDDPVGMYNAFNIGLEEPYPVLWNILVSNHTDKPELNNYSKVKTAKESRLFPSILYNVESGDAFGSHFDLSGNVQTKYVIPVFRKKIKTKGEIKEIECHLTMADYLAMHVENASKLELIPSWYQSDDLVSLESYLIAELRAMDGKIPYIWGVDDNDKMHKVAIPISWVIFCRKHIDYWCFLQELGGVNNPMIETAIERVKTNWLEEKEIQLKELESRLQGEFSEIRNVDLENAIRRMLHRLLNGELDVSSIAAASEAVDLKQVLPKVEEKAVTDVKKKQPEPEESRSVSPEAWVETDECTSCNDCIDALPGVFKYNDDKQAVVHNPKGGTFAKIVAAAEKCPAACIHPGLPLNESEPNLEKLKKRAEKFN